MKRVDNKIKVRNKKSQVTIFIIIAIVLVSIILVLFLVPSVRVIFTGAIEPQTYLEQCSKDAVDEALNIIAVQGGSLNPEHFVMYGGDKVRYLCYTEKYYETCVMQVAFLKQDMEKEISNYIKPKIIECINSLKNNLQSQGFHVEMGATNTSIDLIPNKIMLEVNVPLTVTKESSQRYNKFQFSYTNQLYNMIMVSSSILNWEAHYGDSNPESYMIYYPNIKAEKFKQSDGSTIYILTDRLTNHQFKFASRSVAWPPGYGFIETAG